MAILKKRRPIIAGILSCSTPGLGQLYNGQLKRAFYFYIISIIGVFAIAATNIFSTFQGMILALIAGILYFIIVVIDAIYCAIKIKQADIRPFHRWYIYLIIIAIQIFAVQPMLRELIPYEAYKMPAFSMEPTLKVGDHFIVDGSQYSKNSPQRYDIVVFRYPVDPKKDFIKRVIGLPGERVDIAEKRIFIDKNQISNDFLLLDDSSKQPSSTNNKYYFGPVIVPSGKYFVLGDNLDHSYDSRFWGFVDDSDLKGKVLYIYWSNDRERIGKKIG